MFGAALLFFFLIGLVLFLFIWPATKDFMILLLAWGLGLGITICIKYLVQTVWRFRFYAGLYRTHPTRANMTQLALECVSLWIRKLLHAGNRESFLWA